MTDLRNIAVSEFLDEYLRPYSAHSNVRAVPFIGDGFKQAHRKAVWGMLKRGENADKDTIERIAAASASTTDYAHGSSSLEGTIVGLAQSFTGSNNLPVFDGFGQLGSRLNRKPAASRYIKAKLGKNFRAVFPKDDDLILEQLPSNGMLVEPKFFTPILPLVLINGSDGMGTGHSTYILPHNPSDIKAAILRALDGKKLKAGELLPWWNGFNGAVSRDSTTDQIVVEGKYKVDEGRVSTITINELPIGLQSDSYKAHLDKLEDKGTILDYDNLSDKNGFEFKLKVPRSTAALDDAELKKLLKLTSRETQNFTVWNGDGVLERFTSAEALLEHWIDWRVARYEERRLALIKKTQGDIDWLSEKYRFIQFYLKSVEFFRDSATKVIEECLTKEGFIHLNELLAMPMRSLTKQKIDELKADVEKLKLEKKVLEADTAPAMFKRELKDLKLDN